VIPNIAPPVGGRTLHNFPVIIPDIAYIGMDDNISHVENDEKIVGLDI
jgi:hypothetical protein